DDVIIELDQFEYLKELHLPKLFSFLFLNCFIRSEDSNLNWLHCLLGFLKNHENTLKELTLVFDAYSYYDFHYNNYNLIFDTISTYYLNLTLIGLNVDHLFGYYGENKRKFYYISIYENPLKEFKSFCSNHPRLQKIILFPIFSLYGPGTYKLSKELMLKF